MVPVPVRYTDVPDFPLPRTATVGGKRPIELVERIILALTNEGDWVVDPFMGVGTSLIAALLHNRKAVGADIVKNYCDIAYQRALDALTGKLKRRPLGKPVYTPPGQTRNADGRR